MLVLSFFNSRVQEKPTIRPQQMRTGFLRGFHFHHLSEEI